MEIASLKDLLQIKDEIIKAIQSIEHSSPEPQLKWVKSKKAREILGCSNGTLLNYRQKGIIKASRLDKTWYYNIDSIIERLTANK